MAERIVYVLCRVTDGHPIAAAKSKGTLQKRMQPDYEIKMEIVDLVRRRRGIMNTMHPVDMMALGLDKMALDTSRR